MIIGNGITYIGNRAFDNNYMTDVYCYSKDVPEAEYNAFANDVRKLENTTLHVPAPSIEAYKAAVGWKDFSKIVAIEGTIVPGDVTGNGSVNVQDATIVVNYILGKENNEEYDYSVADMNNDGEVDVFDVTAMIGVILSAENPAKARKVVGIQPLTDREQLYVDGTAIKIDNESRFTSFQMDVEVPDGVELTGAQLTVPETGHILRYTKVGENYYRILALSLNNTPLSATAEGLLKLDLSNGGEVQINDILFVTPRGEEVSMESQSGSIATDITDIETSTNTEIYDLSGRKLDVDLKQLPKGLYIINGKKVMVK